MAWQDDLQPASWRGLPFYVEASVGTFGRNTAVHAYPFKEKHIVWVEDLGRALSAIRVTGFLVGDDVRRQHHDFTNAVMVPEQGALVHPVYGSLIGSIVGGCRFTVRADRGRYVELEFDFIKNDADAPYPAPQADTKADVAAAARDAQAAANGVYDSPVNAPPPAQPGSGGVG